MRQGDPDEPETGDEQPPAKPEISPDDAIQHLEEVMEEWGREREDRE
jgi:hypothetical protein